MPRVRGAVLHLAPHLVAAAALLRAPGPGRPVLPVALAIPQVAARGLRHLGGAQGAHLRRLAGDLNRLLLNAGAGPLPGQVHLLLLVAGLRAEDVLLRRAGLPTLVLPVRRELDVTVPVLLAPAAGLGAPGPVGPSPVGAIVPAGLPAAGLHLSGLAAAGLPTVQREGLDLASARQS